MTGGVDRTAYTHVPRTIGTTWRDQDPYDVARRAEAPG
jgi:hypothetical protein